MEVVWCSWYLKSGCWSTRESEYSVLWYFNRSIDCLVLTTFSDYNCCTYTDSKGGSLPGINYFVGIWTGIFRYKFDDERVTKEDNKRALEEQYGGEEEVFKLYYYHRPCFFFPFQYLPVNDSRLCLNSYHRQILVSITLHLSSPNTQMLICWCIFVKVTRTKSYAMWMRKTLQHI